MLMWLAFHLAVAFTLRGSDDVYLHGKQGIVCQCETANNGWKLSTRTTPQCVFIDLGAADCETYRVFLHKSSRWAFDYVTTPFPKSACKSYLLEANPRFTPDLTACAAQEGSNKVEVMNQTAVYMCDKAQEQFNLDISSATGWGSSLDNAHPDVKSGVAAVNVKVVNLIRLLAENTIQNDTVVVKMDIEGAEWDIIPCLARSPYAAHIDHLYMENHCPGGNLTQNEWCPSMGQAHNTKAEFDAAVQALIAHGVDIPTTYNSPMLAQLQ